MPIYLDLSILSVVLGITGIILYFWGKEKNKITIKQKERLENITQSLRGIYNSLAIYAEAKSKKDVNDLAALIRKQLNGVIGSSSKVDGKEKEKEEEEDNKKNGK